MDTKALAKSKRAHTLHHSKKPHPHKPKPASDRPSGAGGPKAAAEKPPHVRPTRAAPSLPSNWDRYEDEDDFYAESASSLSRKVSSQPSELPPPKSKGADYRHLIEEAKAQPLPQSDPYLDSFPSLEDFLPDFCSRGLGPLLSARGEAIVSMAKDDSFLVEDEPTGSHELPFFFLNLNLLAEQLSKVDLAKRLFVEEDLLPPEMVAEASVSNSVVEPEKVQTGEPESSSRRLGGFDSSHSTDKETKKDGFLRKSSSREPTISVNEVDVDSSQLLGPNPSAAQESNKQSSPAKAFAKRNDETSTFKAAAAEAELDALLNSFNDADLSKNIDSSSSRSAQIKSTKATHEASKAKPAPSSANIDNLLDDLLEETSKLAQNGLQGAGSSVPNGTSRSKVLDDFDSWLDTI